MGRAKYRATCSERDNEVGVEDPAVAADDVGIRSTAHRRSSQIYALRVDTNFLARERKPIESDGQVPRIAIFAEHLRGRGVELEPVRHEHHRSLELEAGIE